MIFGYGFRSSGGGGATDITGTGTANRVTKFTGAQTIGNSSAVDNGTTVIWDAGVSLGVGGVTPTASVHIKGAGNTDVTYGIKVASLAGDVNFYVGDGGAVNSRLGYWIQGSKFAYFGATSLSNTFVGDVSGNLTQTGLYNSCFGQGTGFELTTGYQDTLLGMQAGRFLTVGFNDTLVGFQSGYSMVDGDNCVGVGSSSITDNVSGNRVIGIGCGSGNDSATGNDLIFIGDNTGVSADGWNDSVAIGTLSIITANNQVVFGSPLHPLQNYYFGQGPSASATLIPVSFNTTDRIAGQTDQSAAAGSITWNGAKGTGTGVGGSHIWKVAPGTTTGDTQNPLITILELTGSGVISASRQICQSSLTTLTPSGTTQTIDWNIGNVQCVDLESASGNVTLTLSNPQITCYTLKILQDSTTPRNIIWPATVLWAGGVAPTISTGANAIDTVTLIWDGTNYLGVYSQAYAV